MRNIAVAERQCRPESFDKLRTTMAMVLSGLCKYILIKRIQLQDSGVLGKWDRRPGGHRYYQAESWGLPARSEKLFKQLRVGGKLQEGFFLSEKRHSPKGANASSSELEENMK